MDPVIRKWASFADADAADEESDIRLSPQERLLIVMRLREQYYGDAVHQRLDRVYRIIKLGES